jgi:hypothetical protein
MTEQKPTKEGIIKAWKELDAKRKKEGGKPVGANQVAATMGISTHWIWKLFSGESLSDIKREHGIRLSDPEKHQSVEDLLTRLDEIVSKHKRIPSWNVLTRESGTAESTWKLRLGGSRGCSQVDMYRQYREWLRGNNPDSPNLEIVESFLNRDEASKKMPDLAASTKPRRRATPSYPRTGARLYGKPLNFGNLTFEPTNEQGVVFLFGMVSKTLGFDSIEYLGTDFPDCEGKRRVRGGQQHVRIEFEFKSRNYDHPPHGCDMIVCWEHNWKECPLEVLELKKEIKELRDRPEFRHS